MTENYKKLAASVDEQSKHLAAFLQERGDNITVEDIAEARRIKGDIAEMRTKMKVIEEAEGLKGYADDARDFLETPATGHRHSGGNGGAGGAKVLGATKAGTVFVKADGTERRSRSLKFVRECGEAGAFKKSAFDAASQREYRDAFRAYFKGRPHSGHYRLLEDGLDAQGGYLAPVEVIAKLIERKPAPTSVASYCNTINTGRDRVTLPRVNYTGSSTDDSDGTIYTTGVRVTLTDENPTSETQAQVTDTNLFGAASIDIFTWMLEANLTNNVIEDAMFDPLTWLSQKFSETIDLHKEKMCIKGDPAGPVGLLTNPGGSDTNSWPPVIKTGTSSSPFVTPDSLINMTEDIPTQYDSGVRYLYRRRTTGKTIRTFKDAQGRYLFGEGVQDSGLVPGRSQTLNSYPVSWSDFMPDPAASAYPVVAGDFSGVTIVNRIGFSVQVLRELKARLNQVIIIGRVRFGVSLLEPWKLRVLQCA